MTSSLRVYPVILCGGFGTRLWPLSRQTSPKQFHSLHGNKTLFEQTLDRIQNPDLFQQTLYIICQKAHLDLVQKQIDSANVSDYTIIVEPEGRNTAPAIAAVAEILKAKDPEGIILVIPSDHVIRYVDKFYDCVGRALRTTADGNFVTFGIVPTHAESQYGYIQPYSSKFPCRVDAFIEKPTTKRAKDLITRGCLWNSGIFMLPPTPFLQEFQKWEPETAQNVTTASKEAELESNIIHLGKSFLKCKSISVDYAVMEKTDLLSVIPADMGWSDLGKWSTLWRLSDKDENGNVIEGEAIVTHDTQNSYIFTEGPLVVADGLKDKIVVATEDAVLVSHMDSETLKEAVSKVKAISKNTEKSTTLTQRPWGQYEVIDTGPGYLVKKITVHPHQRLSLQYHNHRSERWTVVKGQALVTLGDKEILLKTNASLDIPQKTTHRIANETSTALEILEIQFGEVLSEQDIVRLEDDYGRILQKAS